VAQNGFAKPAIHAVVAAVHQFPWFLVTPPAHQLQHAGRFVPLHVLQLLREHLPEILGVYELSSRRFFKSWMELLQSSAYAQAYLDSDRVIATITVTPSKFLGNHANGGRPLAMFCGRFLYPTKPEE